MQSSDNSSQSTKSTQNTKSTKNNKNNKNGKSSCTIFKDGKSLTIIAATLANGISEQFCDDELAVLSIFFSTLADALGTIAAANALLNNGNNITEDIILGESLR